MEQKERVQGILGVVADIVKVDKAYETAIETALGGSIQNIVTDTEETAKKLIEFLKRNKYGRATFLPLSGISGKGGISSPQALKEHGRDRTGILTGVCRMIGMQDFCSICLERQSWQRTSMRRLRLRGNTVIRYGS